MSNCDSEKHEAQTQDLALGGKVKGQVQRKGGGADLASNQVGAMEGSRSRGFRSRLFLGSFTHLFDKERHNDKLLGDVGAAMGDTDMGSHVVKPEVLLVGDTTDVHRANNKCDFRCDGMGVVRLGCPGAPRRSSL